MRTLVGPPAYELPDSERECIELLAKDEDLKWIRRETCLCGSTHTSQILDCDRFGLSFDIRLCEGCGLIYFAEVLDEDSMAIYYNKYYGPLVNYGAHYDRAMFCQYKFIEPHIIARYGGNQLKILDVGAGSGELLVAVAKYLSRIGIEAVLFAYEINKARHPFLLERGITIVDSLTEETNRYDLIILSHTLEHLAEPVRYLELFRNLLTHSGILFIEVPGIFSLHNFFIYYYNLRMYDLRMYCPHFHVQSFNALSLSNLASIAGLQPIEVTEIIRAVFCRRDPPAKVANPLLSSNAPRVRNYLKYLETNKGVWGPESIFRFDPFGRELVQPELPATEIPKLIIRKIDRRLHKYLIIQKIERRLGKYLILQKINRRLRKYLKLL